MSQKRAEKLLRRAKRQQKKAQWRTAQRFVAEVVKAHPEMLEYPGVRFDHAIQEQWRRRK